jgi:hypothetical protein
MKLLKTLLTVIFLLGLTCAQPLPTHTAVSANDGGSSNGNGSSCSVDEVNTGLGCIPTSPEGLAKWILKNAIVMGGGIAVLLSFWGGISIITAGGDPEKINQGKQVITSALSGLLFIAFSVFLLRFIGVDILQLPGFEK